MKMTKTCILCQRGVTRRGRGHAYRRPRLGILHVTCPITPMELNNLVDEIMEARFDLASAVPPVQVGTRSK